uniref:Uncharacterized protein n=1 Tax=viral metagenome TaxID=1070528 RepID=A0A6H2A640_9ZZZZ
MNYGTYTTMDAPTEKEDEALEYLQGEFKKIGGTVKIKNNAHDFGSYPSFEIDYSQIIEDYKEAIENHDLYRDDKDEDIPDYILADWLTDDECDELETKIDDWHDKADEIEAKYSKKYFN